MKRLLGLTVVLFGIAAMGLAFVAGSSALAQATSTVTGVVSDPTGAVLVGANVVLSNAATGTAYTGTTNSAGSYRITNVPPGPGYTLAISHGGFNSYRVENVYVNVANVFTRNVTLSLGGALVEISVNAAGQGVTLDTEDATIGNNVQVDKLNELPIQSRISPAALFTMQPGITLGGATTGARSDQNYVTVDGLDVNDLSTGQFENITGSAPVDSVQEFRGTVAGFTAITGSGGGGQFQLVTKSGTNKWHGQANIYHRDNSTTANNWFNDLAHIRAPKLVQNQFGGSVGGPIKHDRAFFFFDYLNSRIAQQTSVLRTVPLPSFQAGNISYINNNAGCTRFSRQDTTPTCISQLTPAQIKASDPAGIGNSPALFNLIKRMPAPNDLTAGNGVNSGGFRFNAPLPTYRTAYVGRVDYNLTAKMRVWGRGSVSRENQVNTAAEFPGDAPAAQFIDRSYAYVAGLDWEISVNKFNQFEYGSTVQDYGFPSPSNVLGIYQTSFSTGTTTPFSDPYSSPVNSQSRHVPIPMVQDSFTWGVGRHSISFGGAFKWISPTSNTVLDYNIYTLGLGGNIQSLASSVRPANILASATANTQYDSALTLALGRVGAISSSFNYDKTGTALPQPTGSVRNYRYYQMLGYVSDTWKVTPHLTLTYGLNYQYFSVPYEKNGLETAQNTLSFDKYIAARVTQSAAGNTTPNALPFLTYVLGGPANKGPGLYNSDPKNFAPKVAFAWSPGFDSSTVFNGGIGTVYDRTVANAVMYQQDQYSYLFYQSGPRNFGTSTDPVGSLKTNARYDAPPAAVAPATPKAPYTPYVFGGNPTGLGNGSFNEMIDPNLKTPYSILANFGVQHQLPGAMILKMSWVGRYGRRLLAQADASQLIEFPDTTSGQPMSVAMGNVTKALRANADPKNLPAQGWFENQVPPGLGASQTYKDSNGVVHHYPNNTSFLADNLGQLFSNGDFADTIQALASNGFLGDNVGMASQFAGNTVYTNKGFSTYNGLLVSLEKNLTQGLDFDVNYTWSHSMDNTSLVANTPAIGGYGFICDTLRPKQCRGNSDFDVTHYINGFARYQLPFGRGRAFGGNIPWGLDELVGGWDVSNVFTWHSGNAWSTVTSAFVAGYANNAPAIFSGSQADVRRNVHKTTGGTLTLFTDPTKAVNAFQGPIGFQVGPRNSLRGPQYFNLDTGLSKRFTVVPDWGLKIQLRGDAFNVLNHPSFSAPGTNSAYDDITQPSNFGQLTSTSSGARVLQISARVEF
jgi:hypothetical protein